MSIIISAYFKIPSKATHEFYISHIRRFLNNVMNHIVFFTTPDLIDIIKEMRGDLPITFISYDSIYDIVAFKKFGIDFWKHQCEIDNEKYHTPEVAAIWYNKKEFVKEAIRLLEIHNIDTYNVPFIWCDAGCVRKDAWQPLIKTFGNNVQCIPSNKLLIQILNNRPNKLYLSFPDICVAGAIMAGYRDTWFKCSEIYDIVLQKYVEAKVCCNSDQHIIATSILLYNDHYECIMCNYPHIISEWFRFLHYLS